MKVTIELDLPDDIQPCCIPDCALYCPFGYLDWEDNEFRCDSMESEGYDWKCIVGEAMKKTKEKIENG